LSLTSEDSDTLTPTDNTIGYAENAACSALAKRNVCYFLTYSETNRRYYYETLKELRAKIRKVQWISKKDKTYCFSRESSDYQTFTDGSSL